MGTFQNLVKRATKVKMAAPKEKYLRAIVMSTSDPEFFQDAMQALFVRLEDSAFTVVFKSLVVLHVMIREGEKNVTLEYLSCHPEYFKLSGLSCKSMVASNAGIQIVRRYNEYLKTRASQYKELGRDYVRESFSNLKDMERNSMVLKHVESLELQITALLRNRYSQYDLNNDMLMDAFRLLVQDILVFYNALNEGIITLLESFFELSRSDAKRTLELYKRFVHLTETVVKYLKAGKAVGLEIPVIKHITTKLIRSLEDHLREGKQQDQHTKAVTRTASARASQLSEAQKRLELVRHQKRLLQEQLQLTSPIDQFGESAPSEPYNPFLHMPQAQQQPNNTHNPFISPPTSFISHPTGFITHQTPNISQQHVIPISLQTPITHPVSQTNPFSLLPPDQQQNPPLSVQYTNPFSKPQPFLQFQQQLQPQQLQPQQQPNGPVIAFTPALTQTQNQTQHFNYSAHLNQASNLIDI